MKLKWKIDICILILILGVGSFFWLGTYTGNATSLYLKSYGGKLSNNILSVLDDMQSDLENAQGILSANSYYIQFIDQECKVQNYQFYHNTLWASDRPVISHVQNFRFEYRNEGGYLITHANRNMEHVETIGYTICVIKNEKDILANGRIKVYPILTMSDISDGDNIS